MRLAVIAAALVCLAPQALLAQSASSRVEVQALAKLLNQHRVAIGCRPLILDRRVAAVALRHSEDAVVWAARASTSPDNNY